MQDWFKARNSWGAGLETLSDAEAGRLAKAIWAYTMRGEQQDISGAERALFALILATLKQDEQNMAELSQKRAAAGALGGKQSQANASKTKQTEANEANAPNKSKNKNTEQEQDIETNSGPDYGEMVEIYNTICGPHLPAVKQLTFARKKHLKSAVKTLEEYGKTWEGYCMMVAESDFLTGRDGKWQNCGFDWLIKTSNMVKVLEGNYGGYTKKKKSSKWDMFLPDGTIDPNFDRYKDVKIN